jgi:hypothetical protein
MPSRAEIDQYFEEQWKLRRVGGDMTKTADDFWRFGEKIYWKFKNTWKSVADTFVTTRKTQLSSKASHKHEKLAKAYVLNVCTLCWHVRDGHNSERKEDDQIPECTCHLKTNNKHELWIILDRCWRFVTLAFERVPTSFELTERINQARTRVTNHHGEEYEARTREWFDAISMTVEVCHA